MAVYNLTINGKKHQVDVDPDTPMLWVLRDHINLVGTKYGCGIGQCGACTVHLDGNAVRSCSLSVDKVQDQKRCTTMWLLSSRSNYECGFFIVQ